MARAAQRGAAQRELGLPPRRIDGRPSFDPLFVLGRSSSDPLYVFDSTILKSVVPLTASGIDILTFTTIDGGTIWYGFLAGADMK